MARSCTRCGTVGVGEPEDAEDATEDATEDDSLPLGWSFATSARGVEAMCPPCTREHVRDIEAKLDETWWT